MKHITSTDWYKNTFDVAVDELVWRPAAYAIIIKDKKILLTKQRGEYHLPGGGVDLGEMPADAVIREVKEETGLIVNKPELIDMISGFFTWNDTKNDKIWHFQSLLLYYTCEFKGGKLSIDGFEDEERMYGELAEWIPLNKLQEIKAGSTIDWRAVVNKYLKI